MAEHAYRVSLADEPEAATGWDQLVPAHQCFGFKASAGGLKLTLGYATFESGQVLLFCCEQIMAQPMQMWRRFWVSRESALEEAENLCADAEEYLDAVCLVRRPSEDLGMDDFLEHLKLRLSNELN